MQLLEPEQQVLQLAILHHYVQRTDSEMKEKAITQLKSKEFGHRAQLTNIIISSVTSVRVISSVTSVRVRMMQVSKIEVENINNY